MSVSEREESLFFKIMKNYFYYSLIVVVCLFTSCSKSNVTPDEPGSGEGGYTDGTYWPFAIGNAWYLVNPEDLEDSYDYSINKTTTYEGKTYFQVKPIGVGDEVDVAGGFREDKGVFTTYHAATSSMGTNTSAGTITYLNTNLKPGEVWKDNMTIQISGGNVGTIKYSHEGKIVEKLDRVVVHGKTYKDVIKTELKQVVQHSLNGVTYKIIYEQWLAKGIGLIYDKTIYDDADVTTYELKSYTVK